MASQTCLDYLYHCPPGAPLILTRFLPRTLRWILTGAWLACAGAGLGAQTLAFRHFDHRDGLPESQVLSLMEDRDGFLWVGSGNSLCRMGSGGFHVISGAQGLGCRNLTALLQDRRGSIWAGGAGLSEVRGGVITNYGPDQGLTVDDRIFALTEDGAGKLLVGTRLGLFRRQGLAFEQVKLPGNWFYTPIFSMAPDGMGLWIGSRKGLLAHWDGKELNQVHLPKGFEQQSVLQLQREKDGSLLVLLPKVLLRLEPSGWRVEPLPGLTGSPDFRSFREDDQGLVLTQELGGVYLRNPQGQGRSLTYHDGLPRLGLFDALQDHNGVLWVGTSGAGLLALPRPSMRTLAYNRATGLDLGLGNVLNFLELPGNRMLMATFGGLVLWDEDKGTQQRWDIRNGLPSNEVWTLLSDGRGGAWVGLTKGLVHWTEGRIQPGPPALLEMGVNQLLRHEGRLWAATTKGVAELDLDGRFLSLSAPPQEVGGAFVSQLLPRPWGLLVGTQLGPYSFREGQFKKVYSGSPVAKLEVNTLNEDDQGHLWLGTLHGLFGLLGPPSNRTWKAMGGRLQNGISWVRVLPSGGLAVGHAKGVTVLSPSGEPMELTHNLGLLSDETNQDAAYLDHRGRLWVGMLGGVSILGDLEDRRGTALPPPRLLEAAWEGHSEWLPQSLELPPNPSNLSLAFDTPLPCAAQAPRYQVRIDGLHGAWTDLEGAGSSVQIAQLGAGSYTFMVRASLDGVNWVTSAPLAMHVRRAWHQTWTARAAFLLGVIGLLILVIHLRVKSLKGKAADLEAKIQERTGELALRNRSLERLHHQLKHNMEGRIHFINSVTHDLRSPLTSIQLGVDRLRDLGGEQMAPVMRILEREAKRMETLLKGLLDQSRADATEASLDVRLCHPDEILQGLTETFQLKAQARDLRPELDLDRGSDVPWVLVDVTAMQQVLFNLVENALKLTSAPGVVGIRSRVAEKHWVLEVWDQGRGIEPAKLEMIFLPFSQARPSDGSMGWGLGLSICKAITEAHEGTIEVESELEHGSLFRVTLPLVQC